MCIYIYIYSEKLQDIPRMQEYVQFIVVRRYPHLASLSLWDFIIEHRIPTSLNLFQNVGDGEAKTYSSFQSICLIFTFNLFKKNLFLIKLIFILRDILTL